MATFGHLSIEHLTTSNEILMDKFGEKNDIKPNFLSVSIVIKLILS